ncbi:phosphotyrosine protein phosphatase [Candidatus Thiomargarita nelsonii]|uniref:protein-tyrosine-phosphatase n=1 Tax=Candidatus Thiomargarita nelsonii TaxID=1003181 RepID=A0A0A6RVA1_9GAMM|nr:phosphotyrosine protein phosphatase [Candidatus Thiomargarita nelsonii]
MTKILFVCMGNICRSPTAEGVFTRLVTQTGNGSQISSDSAGTHDYHIGEPPDLRSQKAALKRGIDLSSLRARQVTPADFTKFDYILAMDRHNYQILQSLCPPEQQHKLRFFLEFAPELKRRDVPDPYYEGGFDYILDLVEAASRGLLDTLNENDK